MAYADLTFRDPKPVKRWLQRRRLATAAKLSGRWGGSPKVICDFGAGNGELLRLLSEKYPEARLVCYEPAPSLLDEARQRLADDPRVEFRQEVDSLADGSFDLLSCLEVFEHLPPEETSAALSAIGRLLQPGGVVVIGVPVEVGLPALYKGMFRWARRRGSYDTHGKNVLSSTIGRPPRDRPIVEIAPGIRFHSFHMGFDHRTFRRMVEERFTIVDVSASPFRFVGTWLMPEVTIVVIREAGSGGRGGAGALGSGVMCPRSELKVR
jgi:SAM-dependent methyltransferase